MNARARFRCFRLAVSVPEIIALTFVSFPIFSSGRKHECHRKALPHNNLRV